MCVFLVWNKDGFVNDSHKLIRDSPTPITWCGKCRYKKDTIRFAKKIHAIRYIKKQRA